MIEIHCSYRHHVVHAKIPGDMRRLEGRTAELHISQEQMATDAAAARYQGFAWSIDEGSVVADQVAGDGGPREADLADGDDAAA